MRQYWISIFAMAGSACIAVAFIDNSIYSMIWGVILVIVGAVILKQGNK